MSILIPEYIFSCLYYKRSTGYFQGFYWPIRRSFMTEAEEPRFFLTRANSKSTTRLKIFIIYR